ncbi:MAG: FAD:protein FMN transferase [bacterium]|nr:FAD:protein FMN transferase [bacterium]
MTGTSTIALTLALAAPLPASSAEVRRARYVMGTIFEITAHGSDSRRVTKAVEKAFEAIRQSDRTLSHYVADSDLSRFNASRGTYEASEELYQVVARSIELSQATSGAFDITVAGLVTRWERAAGVNQLPSGAEIAALLRGAGCDHIRLQPGNRLSRANPNVRINVGGIGKGWAVDRAIAVLGEHGIHNALVSAGTSTVYGLGHPPGEPAWKVGVRDPRGGDGAVRFYDLRDKAISTSAGYERYFEIEGRRHSHILDPRTGWPVDHTLSATVIASGATEADALSTAVYVLGATEGAVLIRRLGLEAYIVASDGAERTVP